MPKASYFRQQADTCTRLALAASDGHAAERFVLMAHEYLAKAAEAELSTGPDGYSGSSDHHAYRDLDF